MTTNNIPDPAMVDLFRMELEEHSGKLLELLPELHALVPASLDQLVRAAHSIKGAARVVGLNKAVGLAAAMEELFDSFRKGTQTPGDTHSDVLMAGVQLYSKLAASDDIPEMLAGCEAEFISLTEKLSGFLTKESPAAGVVNKAASSEKRGTPMPPPISPVTAEIAVDIPEIDPAMADLFKSELETHTQVLETGLLDVEKNQTPERIEPLMRAAHSIKGAARMVGVTPCVGLAHSMEDLLVDAQKGNVTLTSAQIDILLQGTDIFALLAKTDVKDFATYLGREADAIASLIAALKGAPAVELTEQKAAAMPGDEPTTKARTLAPASKATGKTGREDEVIRIQAEKLTRLIGLSGECLIQAKSAQNFQGLLKHIKDLYLGMESRLTKINGILIAENASKSLNEEIQELGDSLARTSEYVSTHMEKVKFLSWRLETLADHLYGEVLNIRMQPFSEGMYGFSRMVRDLSKDLGKKVDFEIGGSNSMVDSNILKKLEAPLNHLVRNALDHAIEFPEDRVKAGKTENGKILVEARHRSGMLEVLVQDDGKGIDFEGLKRKIIERNYASADMVAKMSRDEISDFLFLPGFSTSSKVTTISGRGVGLDIVNAMTQEVGGQVSVTSEMGKGTTFLMRLPLTLSVLRVLLVEIAGEPYGIQLSRIDSLLDVSSTEIAVVEDRQYITIKGEQIGLLSAHQVLQLPQQPLLSDRVGVIVISDRMNQYGLVVDRFLGSREVVVLPLDPRLGKIPNVRAGAVLDDGSPLLILDGNDLVRSIDNLLNRSRLRKVTAAVKSGVEVKKRVLVVDDSLTVREVERRLLENRGYDVTVAVDGMDGWNTLQNQTFDLVISDIDMPRMTGFELVGRIKRHPTLKAVPVMIVSYKDREEDRMRGLAAGANYYFTKSSFHDETLIAAVRDLIGDP